MTISDVNLGSLRCAAAGAKPRHVLPERFSRHPALFLQTPAARREAERKYKVGELTHAKLRSDLRSRKTRESGNEDR